VDTSTWARQATKRQKGEKKCRRATNGGKWSELQKGRDEYLRNYVGYSVELAYKIIYTLLQKCHRFTFYTDSRYNQHRKFYTLLQTCHRTNFLLE